MPKPSREAVDILEDIKKLSTQQKLELAAGIVARGDKSLVKNVAVHIVERALWEMLHA